MRHVDDFVEFRRNVLGFIQTINDASTPTPANPPSPASRSISTIEKDSREHTDSVPKTHPRRETMKPNDTRCGKPRLGPTGDKARSTDENNAQPVRAVMCMISPHDGEYDILADQRTHSAESSKENILSSNHKASLDFIIHRANDS
jgi:hypothetical protein